MVSMTDWIRVLQTLGCPLTTTELSKLIKERFLVHPRKVLGSYVVNEQALWDYMLSRYPVCKKNAEDRRLSDAMSVEGWLEEIRYQQMRSTYPRNKHKKAG